VSEISVRKLASVLKKLEVKNGNIILIKRSVVSQGDDYETFRKALDHLNLNAMVIVVDDTSDVKSLDDTMMRQLGWVRSSPLKMPPYRRKA
jgi:hypothetical protein